MTPLWLGFFFFFFCRTCFWIPCSWQNGSIICLFSFIIHVSFPIFPTGTLAITAGSREAFEEWWQNKLAAKDSSGLCRQIWIHFKYMKHYTRFKHSSSSNLCKASSKTMSCSCQGANCAGHYDKSAMGFIWIIINHHEALMIITLNSSLHPFGLGGFLTKHSLVYLLNRTHTRD